MSGEAATLKPPVGGADHRLGEVDAPVTLVEYGDYQCHTDVLHERNAL